MTIKEKMYSFLVRRNPGICAAYEDYVSSDQEGHRKHRLRSRIFLFLLNIQHCLCGDSLSPREGRLAYPESGTVKRPPAAELAGKLVQYDVISFDIFDTLIFRAMARPQDVFFLIENRLGIIQFSEARMEAEQHARKHTDKPNGEINIHDIYDVLSMRTGIGRYEGIQAELDAERDICQTNPYILDVVKTLHAKGKKIIAVSDTYLTDEMVRSLLESCGYGNLIDEVFISCDCLCSKHDGSLQAKAWDKIGRDKSVIHVGDNYNSDIRGSEKAGWEAFYYKNVNEIGKPYRPAGMSEMGYSVYSGLVNAKLHGGAENCDTYYELGYAYGGILACGYCEWLNRYAKANDIDKILFSSRDMYIIHEIYNRHYRQVDNDYVLISRYAAQRFSFDTSCGYFVSTHLGSRANSGKLKLGEALSELGLSFLNRYIGEYGLSEDMLFTKEELPRAAQCIYDHREEILKELEPERQAALRYYSGFVQGRHRIAVADFGWQGTNAMCLKSLLEKELEGISVFSALMCAMGRPFLNRLMSTGTADAYCFSTQHDGQLAGRFAYTQPARFLLELMFSSTEQSLKGFRLTDEGEPEPEYIVNEHRNPENLLRILQGIRDYAEDYSHTGIKQGEFSFSGYEAIMPIVRLSYSRDYVIGLLSGNEVNPWIGETVRKDTADIQAIVRR